MANDRFWSLKKELDEEVHSLCLSLGNITDDDLSDNLYIRFSQQINHVQNIFDDFGSVLKDLVLDQNDPEFYDLLKGKQEVSDLYGEFNRQKTIFYKRFAKFRKIEDPERERFVPEQEEEPSEEDIPEEIWEDEGDWEEEYDPDAEEQEKSAARKARQKRLAAEGKKRDAQNAEHQRQLEEQRLRQEEAQRLGMNVRPGQSVSEADLQNERLRQDQEQTLAHEQEIQKLRDQDEALRRTRERIEQSEQFEHLQSHHIDMSQEGIGHQGSDAPQNDAFAGQDVGPVPHVRPDEPQQRARADYSDRAIWEEAARSVNQPHPYQEQPYSFHGQPHPNQAEAYLKQEQGHPFEYRPHFYQEPQTFSNQEVPFLNRQEPSGPSVYTPFQFTPVGVVPVILERPAYQGVPDPSSSGPAPFQHSPVPNKDSFADQVKVQDKYQVNDQVPYTIRHVPEHLADHIRHEGVTTQPSPVFSERGREWNRPVDSNSKIYSALMTNRTEPETEPVVISPVFETLMQANVERARMAYRDSQGLPSAQTAAHQYMKEREVLLQLRNSVKEGTIKFSEPVPVSPVVLKEDKAPFPATLKNAGSIPAAYSFTPMGTAVHTVVGGQSTGNRYEFANPGLRFNRPAYSPSNPMVVSPKYEEAIISKMRTATESLNTAVVKGDKSAKSVDPVQMKLFTDAYFGFQTAKREGSVVVSSTGNGPDVPDYFAWQQKRQAASSFSKPILGTTAQTKGPNPNQVSKKTVEEAVTNIFNQSSRLKQQSLASIYARQVGSRFTNYSSSAMLYFSQKMYRMIQSGDDNALQTFETGRYYVTTAAGVVLAVQSGPPGRALANRVSHASAREFNLYGTKSLMTSAELSKTVNNNLRLSRELDVKIGSIKREIDAFAPYSELDKLSRRKFDKLSLQLADLEAEKGVIQNSLSLHQKLKTLRHESKLEDDLLNKLKAEGKGKVPTNPKALQAAGQKIHTEASDKLKEKYGSLTKMTDKSIAKEIELLTNQGASLKVQIRMLEGKGSSLTQAERRLLDKLKKDAKALGVKIGKLKSFQRANADLLFKDGKMNEIIQKAYKNKARMSNALFAFQNFVIRPLQAGFDSNTEGMAKLVQISSNRYVHILLKKSYKASLFMGKATLNLVSPGSVDAMSMAMNIAKTGIKANVGVATNTIKTAAKAGVHTAGQHLVNAVPNGIKTSVKSTMTKVSATKSKLDTVATGVKNAVFKAKVWAANTRAGQAVAALARFNQNAAEAIKAAATLLKGVLVKGLAIFALVFIVIGFISVIVSLLGGAAGSTVIASPYDTVDGKIDLSRYVEIIGKEQVAFQQELNALGTNDDYDNVFVNYTGSTSNTKEMLAMMAVRMSQELDLDENPEVEKYLKSLFKDSHTFSTEEYNYECAGCEEETYEVLVYDEYLDLYTWEEKTRMVCDGHTDLTITISVLRFDEIFSADTYSNGGFAVGEGGSLGNFTITYYCCEKYPHICNAGPPYKTATGTTPTPGRTIAVDPSVIPLGTHVVIDGHEYIAEDTGGAINQKRIDIVVGTHQEALRKGIRRNVPVYAPSYEGSGNGSYEDSGVWEGWTEENIEWCKLIYNMDWNELYTGFTDFNGMIESGDLIVNGDFTWPVTSTNITSYFGYRQAPTAGASTMHKGVDIGIPVGTPVHAMAGGTVMASQWDPGGGGYYVKINHGNGIISRYLHNSTLLVRAGDRVEAGQVICLSGNTGTSTGPHLDFRIEVNGTYVDPLPLFGLG